MTQSRFFYSSFFNLLLVPVLLVQGLLVRGLLISWLLISGMGCASLKPHGGLENMGSASFAASGTIILSHMIPARTNAELAANVPVEIRKKPGTFAPLIGYFPPAANYIPAENESWLEIVRNSRRLLLHRGKGVIKEIQGEGDISIEEGEYYLQHKQKEPLWYAPDDYFKRRRLAVPPVGNRLRYRRGALGKYALYPTTTFAIHCGPIWSEDVGGLRISLADLSSIYYLMPIGAPIIVR